MSLGRHDRAGSLLSSVVDDRSLLSSAGGKQNETYETKVKARTRLKHPASSLVQPFLLKTTLSSEKCQFVRSFCWTRYDSKKSQLGRKYCRSGSHFFGSCTRTAESRRRLPLQKSMKWRNWKPFTLYACSSLLWIWEPWMFTWPFASCLASLKSLKWRMVVGALFAIPVCRIDWPESCMGPLLHVRNRRTYATGRTGGHRGGHWLPRFQYFPKTYRYRPGMIRWPVQLTFFQCLLLSNCKYCMWSCVMKGQVSSSLSSACFSHFLAPSTSLSLARQPRASGMASCQITSTSRSASTFLDLWENQDEHPFSSATFQCLDSLWDLMSKAKVLWTGQWTWNKEETT